METTEWCNWSAKKVEEGEKLRESVRMLAELFRRKCDAHTERWETEGKDKDLGLAVAHNDACKELSALIDGKEQS